MNDGDIVVYANNVAEQFDAATRKANAKAARRSELNRLLDQIGFQDLSGTARLMATRQLYQTRPDLRRELLDAVTAGILRAPATIGIDPTTEIATKVTVSKPTQAAPSPDGGWITVNWPAADLAATADGIPPAPLFQPDLEEPYRRASVGLRDALTRATTMQISSTPTIGSLDALSGGERQVKLAPKKPEVPMAPPAGRRKIRLED